MPARRNLLIALLVLPFLLSPCTAGQPPPRPGKVIVYHYESELDNTRQPFSVWLPQGYSPKRKYALFVQLHGLGGTHKMGGPRAEVRDSIVVAPDGRGATDYKLWGEDDVVRVVHECKKLFSVDDDLVYLYGFSMGGSGSWQVGVHYPDLFAALGPVCGNADHRVWERLWEWGEKNPTYLSPKKAWVEATESAAFFAENLINVPSYPLHGARDNVVPVGHARSMSAELAKAGAPCVYDESPTAGHGIPGDMVSRMLKAMREHKRDPWPKRVVFKTACRRHRGAYWVRVHRFQRPFAFARVEAKVAGPNAIEATTDNLEELSLHLVKPLVDPAKPVKITIDGRQQLNAAPPKGGWLRLRKLGEAWKPSAPPAGLHKKPGLEGPVMDAFRSSFLIVFGTQGDDDLAKKVAREEARIITDRWNRWARGRARVKADRDVTDEDIQTANLVLVGDVATHSLIPRVIGKLPIRIEGNAVLFGDNQRWEGDDLGLKLIYPNPLNPDRCVVLFTGTTWRGVYQTVGRFGNWFDWGILDGWHWQDFAVFDNRSHSPETFLAVGFFDNDWKLNPAWTLLGDQKLRAASPTRHTATYRTPPPGIGQMYLSNLQPVHTRIEKGAVGRDRSFNARPITLGGRVYERGFGIHTNFDIAFDLGGQFGTFEAVVGTDLEGEQAVSAARDRAESFECMVVGDGKMLYSSGRMRWKTPPRAIYIPIQGVRRLELKTHRRSGPRWLSGPVSWGICRVGEPIRNRTVVAAKPAGPGPLVQTFLLDGTWSLAGFEVGDGIVHQAHRGAAAAWKNGVDAPVPGSVFAAIGAGGARPELRQLAADREWWYRRSFALPAAWAGRAVWIELDGAAHSADAWLNGRWIGRTPAPFAAGRFDATAGATLGGDNTLVVRVTASPAQWARRDAPFQRTPGRDLITSQHLDRLGYPMLGLWRPVRVKATGPAVLRDLHVETVALTGAAAKLRVTAELASLVKDKLPVVLAGTIDGARVALDPVAFEKKLDLDGKKTAAVDLEVDLPKPRLWWPYELGDQPLYRIDASLKTANVVSDARARTFGVRTIELDTSQPIVRLRINGQKTLAIRGAVWTPADALLRSDATRIRRLLARARDVRLNTLRVWGGGIAETDAFYALCDHLGFLVLQEFPLASAPQELAAEAFLRSAAETVARLRARPSLAAWCVGGAVDPADPPSARLTRELLDLCGRLDPRRRCILESPKTGVARVWSVRTDAAARRTYWTSAALPTLAGVPSPPSHRTLAGALGGPPEWPSAAPWARAAAAAPAVAAYGRADAPRQLILKAQAAQAAALQRSVEHHRLTGAGHVLWQLTDSAAATSPALIDCAGWPKPAYYALRHAGGPLAIFADFGRRAPTHLSVGETLQGEVCVQDSAANLRGVTASAVVLDRSMRRLAAWQESFDAPRGVLVRPILFQWTAAGALAGDVCFLRLALADRLGRVIASNLYWFAVRASRPAAPRLRVAWLTAQPAGPLADPALLAATGLDVVRPEIPKAPDATPAEQEEPDFDEEPAPPPAAPPPAVALEGFDAIVVDSATVFDEYRDVDAKAVADAVSNGAGLFIDGLDESLRDTALAPLLPLDFPGGRPTGLARRPIAVDPSHPVFRDVSFATCPPLARRQAVRAKRGTVLATLGPGHPFLVEATHGRGRVLALAAQRGDPLADWPDGSRFHAAVLGYLARLPHGQFSDLLDATGGGPLEALDRLGPASVQAVAAQEGDTVAVRLVNTSGRLAFMVHLDAAPVGAAPPAAALLSLSENYLSLLPGETATIRLDAHRRVAPPPEFPKATFGLTLRGWNLAPCPLEGQLVLDRGRVALQR